MGNPNFSLQPEWNSLSGHKYISTFTFLNKQKSVTDRTIDDRRTGQYRFGAIHPSMCRLSSVQLERGVRAISSASLYDLKSNQPPRSVNGKQQSNVLTYMPSLQHWPGDSRILNLSPAKI